MGLKKLDDVLLLSGFFYVFVSRSIAVGSLAFVDKVKSDLGVKAMHREVAEVGGTYTLREPSEAYAGDFTSESDVLTSDNTSILNFVMQWRPI
jgi:hypothetical protein